MSYRITVLPEGRQFIAESKESLLGAAIRSGVALDYGCANGNCGRCKAKIISGDLERISPTDFPMSLNEKSQGFELLCAHAAASDVTFEAHPAHGAEDILEQGVRVRVRDIEFPCPALAVLRLRTPRSQRLRFLAGQYASLGIGQLPAFDGSIASCPCDDMNIEFHIRQIQGEAFSESVFSRLKPGDRVELIGPKGDFVLDEAFDGPLLFIAFDTGFAAIKSLLEHVTAQDTERPIVLYWISCGADGPYLSNLCRSWADAFDQFSYRPRSIPMAYPSSSAEADRATDYLEVLFDSIVMELEEDARKAGPSIVSFECFVSAPEPLLRMADARFKALGIAENRLKLEPIRGNRELSCLRSDT